MDRLFAPWRIEWVKRELPSDECVFCDIPDRHSDREELLVARAEKCYVLLNNSPYNPGHMMIIPYSHKGDYTELTNEEVMETGLMKQRAIQALRRTMEPDGINTGLNLGHGSGGSIKNHLHIHVVPRWRGDTNYMAVTADTKIVVQALQETYDELHSGFTELDKAETTDENNAVQFR